MDREAYEIGLPFIEKAGVVGKINFVQSDAISGLEELLQDVSFLLLFLSYKLSRDQSIAHFPCKIEMQPR